MQSYFFDLVIMAAQATGTPHASALQSANAGLEIRTHYYDAPEDPAARLLAWRNGDRNIRAWWIANRDAVAADAVLFLEWDVYANIDLRDVIPQPKAGTGLMAAGILSAVKDARSFRPFAEVGRLPRDMRAWGLSPLGVVLLTRAALDAIADAKYDALFAADIFSELRFPSAVFDAGFQLQAIPLPDVTTTPVTPKADARGIWHPVKFPVFQ